MVHVFGSLIAATYHYLFIIVQIALGDTLYLLAHRCREEQRVAVFGNTLQDGVDAL